MKKTLFYALSLLLVAFFVAGCGGDSKKETKMILATGGTSGTYYPLGGAMAQIWNSKAQDVNVTAQSTGASVENLRLVDKKEAELGIVQSDTMDYAFNGTEVFKDNKLANIRAIAYMYPEFIQIVARPDKEINSIEDLKGKKVGVGAPGSGTEANFRQLIESHGLTYDDMDPQYLSFSECADRYKDNQIDAFIVVAGLPNSAIQDITTQHEVKILSISEEMIEKIHTKYPFLTSVAIPANTYKGQDAEVKTVAVMATLIVNSTVSDDVVYSITKALFENKDALASANAKGKELNIENAIKDMNIPVHPGAEKYFKEKGVLK